MPMGNERAAGVLGGIIAAIRDRDNLTQADLAVRTGISLRTLGHYENGERLPSLPLFYTIVTTLKLNPKSVLNRMFRRGR